MSREDRNSFIEQRLPRIYIIAGGLASRLPPGVDVDDLVNECCLSMARHLDRGLAWSWRRVHGAMLDFIDGHHQERRGAMPREITSRAANPEQLAIRRDNRNVEHVLRNALQLTPRERAVLRLASSGASGQRVAQQLRIGDRQVRKLKQSALSRLASLIA